MAKRKKEPWEIEVEESWLKKQRIWQATLESKVPEDALQGISYEGEKVQTSKLSDTTFNIVLKKLELDPEEKELIKNIRKNLKQLDIALSCLTERQQEIIEVRYRKPEGNNYREIGNELNISEGTVSNDYKQALRIIAEVLLMIE